LLFLVNRSNYLVYTKHGIKLFITLSLCNNGNDTFIQNVRSHTDYGALYPRRWQHFITADVRTSNPTNVISPFILTNVVRTPRDKKITEWSVNIFKVSRTVYRFCAAISWQNSERFISPYPGKETCGRLLLGNRPPFSSWGLF
jgi:hypothetical protein